MIDSQKLDCLLEQMQEMRKEAVQRFDQIENRLDHMDKEINGMGEDIAGMGRDINNIVNRLEKLESDNVSLKAGQLKNSQELKHISARVEETYLLALEAWGQSTENRHMLTSF